MQRTTHLVSTAAGKPFLFPSYFQVILSIWYCVCHFIHHWISKERLPHRLAFFPHIWEQKGYVCSLSSSDFPSLISNHFLVWNNSVSGGDEMEQEHQMRNGKWIWLRKCLRNKINYLGGRKMRLPFAFFFFPWFLWFFSFLSSRKDNSLPLIYNSLLSLEHLWGRIRIVWKILVN